MVIRGTAGGGVAAPAVKADTLVRIDPATNKVDAVVDVGQRPSAIAVGGRSVWVYNDAGPSVSEIDAATRHRPTHDEGRRRTQPHLDAFAGPVLAADAAGAWLVGIDARGRSYLTRVFSGPRGKREYRLEQRAPCGRGRLRRRLGGHARRIATTRCCASTRPPATSRGGRASPPPRRSTVSPPALAASGSWPRPPQRSTGSTLARQRVTGRIDLGERAARPEVVLGSIWVGLSDSGGDTVIVDPRTLDVVKHLGCCPPERGYDAARVRLDLGLRHADRDRRAVGRSDLSRRLQHPCHGSAVLRRAVPDLDRGRRRCCVGDGRRETSNAQPAAEPPAAAQPASAHLSLPSVPAATLASDVVDTTRGGEQCAGS